MNDEEKEAIKMFEFCSNYNCVLDEKRTETILNLIVKLQKENEELKSLIVHKNEYTKKLEEDLFENSNNYVIPIQKVKDKIEELQNGPLKINENNKYYYETEAYNKIIIQVLQELLEGRK